MLEPMDDQERAEFEAEMKSELRDTYHKDNTPKTSPNASKVEQEIFVDLYEEGTIPNPVLSYIRLSARDFCMIISNKFKSSITDYVGCTFRMRQNGNLEFVMILENRPEVEGKYKVLELNNSTVMVDDGTAKAAVEARKSTEGRKVCRMSSFGEQFFKPFMNRYVKTTKNNTKVEKPIEWNKVLEEREEGSQNPYVGYSPSRYYSILTDINLDAIAKNMCMSTELKELNKKGLKENARFNPTHTIRVQIMGFENKDQYGRIFYTMMPQQIVRASNGTFYTTTVQLYNNIPLDNLYLNIEIIDNREGKKVYPNYNLYRDNASILNIV